MTTCKKCLKTNLKWRKVGGQWKLFNVREEIHSCKGINLKPTMSAPAKTIEKSSGQSSFDMYNDYHSQMHNQDETERLTTMILGG